MKAEIPMLKQNLNQSQVQMHRLVMLPQMQQALHILQMPVMELASLVEACLAENPLVADSEAEEDFDGLEREIENENEDNSEEMAPEKELAFTDRDLSILDRLDDDFRSYFLESGEFRRTRTKDDAEKLVFAEQTICDEPSLFEHLMRQAHETFDNAEDLAIAEALIGNFDSRGFLTTSWSELVFFYHFPEDKLRAVLQMIQTFEPYGVGASNLQESLLIQLRCHGKQETLSAAIIEKHYDDLIHNRIPEIKKGLGCKVSDIENSLKNQIAHLDLHPGGCFRVQPVSLIIPDVTLTQEGDQIQISINEDFMPTWRINSRYLKMLQDPEIPKETKEYLQSKLASLKWLLRNVRQRNQTLISIAEYLCKKQKDFLINSEGKLKPMSMSKIAEDLSLNVSTVTRAVSNKYIWCLKGVLPLRTFFTSTLKNKGQEKGKERDKGLDHSSHTARDLLKELIKNEDKKRPLSDADLSVLLKERGIECARRTVAKYRGDLNVGNAQQRRKFLK